MTLADYFGSTLHLESSIGQLEKQKDKQDVPN